MAKATIVGKIKDLKVSTYKKGGEDKNRTEFTLREWTRNKHPEGHPYAGQTVYNWHRCKVFNGTGEAIAKHFKDGDYIVVTGEFNFSTYARENVDVELDIPGVGKKTLKGTVQKYPSVEFLVDGFDFCRDADTGNNGSSAETLDVSDEQMLAGLAALANSTDQAAAGAEEKKVISTEDDDLPF